MSEYSIWPSGSSGKIRCLTWKWWNQTLHGSIQCVLFKNYWNIGILQSDQESIAKCNSKIMKNFVMPLLSWLSYVSTSARLRVPLTPACWPNSLGVLLINAISHSAKARSWTSRFAKTSKLLCRISSRIILKVDWTALGVPWRTCRKIPSE